MIFALVIKIALDAVYKRVAVAAFVLVDYHSDGLIHKQNVFVLVYNVYLIAYTGKIIGIVYRKNDVEDKLIMAPESVAFTQNEIKEQINFQEQYYETEIEALFQKSCGAVIFRKTSEGFE